METEVKGIRCCSDYNIAAGRRLCSHGKTQFLPGALGIGDLEKHRFKKMACLAGCAEKKLATGQILSGTARKTSCKERSERESQQAITLASAG